ncbi:MAG: c-type cytochrome [Nevskia sp.]|nr:c-type cytochrome [Nevskia sp.]
MKAVSIPALCLLLAALPALADHPDAAQLAKSKQCLSCHAVDTQAYAPSFKDIARRHSAADTGLLVRKIRAGGRQHWGEVAMPRTGTLGTPVTDAEARALAAWVLSQK